jgi:hypothetical protein
LEADLSGIRGYGGILGQGLTVGDPLHVVTHLIQQFVIVTFVVIPKRLRVKQGLEVLL